MWSVSIKRTRLGSEFTFQDLLKWQDEKLREIQPAKKSALLFAEVEPVITLGTRQIELTSEQKRLGDLKERAKKIGMNVVAGERGGLETWHGPGQWVGYVLSPLEKFTGDPKGVRKAVKLILETLIPVTKLWVPEAHIREDAELGIWSDRGKLVSVGIKIKNGYITSGFSINVYPTELSFKEIHPCGIAGAKPDFLFKDRLVERLWAIQFSGIPGEVASAFSLNIVK